MQPATTTVNLKGRKPQALLPGEIYIGRVQKQGGWDLTESIWHNPYSVKTYGRDECLELYRNMLTHNPELMAKISELKGKVLACWCSPEPCHGDILAELANKIN
jgi:hypothetical protein